MNNMSFFDKEADLFSAFDGSSSKNKRSKPDDADTDDGPRKKAKISNDDGNSTNNNNIETITNGSTNTPSTSNPKTDAKSQHSHTKIPESIGAHVAQQETITEVYSRVAPKEQAVIHFGDKQAVQDTELLEEKKACQHELCVPDGWVDDFDPNKPKKPPAKTYPFELDPFQKVSVSCLEKGHSVLVSAHTSAGKTVVALYSIAMALRDKQRVIYTSPIKALSNQKYRDLHEEFNDVGLMTGDITINPSASCLVMTTEILRSMLYRGSEILREVGWVIFDEIHYMRDKERGVVWEETIILLPDPIKYVFLSATIPNASEFASWIAKIHKQPCHVVYTDFRPVPLQHYIFPSGGDGLFLVVDEKGTFREENFQKALSILTPDTDKKKRHSKGGNTDPYKIVKMIMERNYEPVIVFSFSKRSCENLALQMAKLDFNNDDEKKLVSTVYQNALDTLNDDDRKLPQVEQLLPLLKRGIGIHHSGLLPLLKEIIELLFQEGLIKCLFATETFSIGLNMPAKTVVFTSVRKFDGSDFRWVSGGEYIQMSGRAGRRGKDDRGIVIMMVDEKMEPTVAQGMVKGHADTLNSSFHIGYNMLLNLLRTDFFTPEAMLKQSFHQFQNDGAIPTLARKVKELETDRDGLLIDDEDTVAEYYALRLQIEKMRVMIRQMIQQPAAILPFLSAGRLIRVRDFDNDQDWGWGVVVNFHQRTVTTGQSANANDKKAQAPATSQVKYIVDVLLACAPNEPKHLPPKPCPTGTEPDMQVVPITLAMIENVSSIKLHLPKDLRPMDARKSVLKSLKETKKRMPGDIPVLDPVETMGIKDPNFKKIVRKLETLEDKMKTNPQFKEELIHEKYLKYVNKMKIENELKDIKKQIKKTDNVILKDELKAMKRVLRRLGYTNKDNIIEVKGRVACEINTGDELVLTELIFMGFFNTLDVTSTVAVLTLFVFQEKSSPDGKGHKMRDELQTLLRQVQDVARRVATVMQECKVTIEIEDYVKKFQPDMMEVAWAWANGSKFSDICKLTDIFEGSIIRAIRRLEELMRQLVSAAKSIGNSELENKFAEGITKIKRDIVFAASLYLAS